MEFLGYELGEILTRQFIYFIVIFFIGVILLHVATSILDFKKRSFGKAAGVLITGSIVSFILAFIPYIGRILGLIGFWFFIKSFYDVGWGKAILTWIMSIVVAFIIALVVLVLFNISILFIPNL
jgi:hypothetical protein